MNKVSNAVLTAAAFVIGAAASASAAGADVNVALSGTNEVPPVTTSASGSGMFKVGDDGAMSGTVTVQGAAGTMAHIHMAAAGKNGPPIVSLAKEGDTFKVPAGTKLTPEQVNALKAGELYVNVHTAGHPGGELRGQLK